MDKLFKNKDVKVIILEVFLIALGLVGLTLGVKYIMNSINVNVDTSKLAIDSMNANVTNGTLTPIEDSTVNINTTSNVLRITFDVKGASTNTGNNIIYDAILNIDADCSLKNENIKWNLYKNNNLLTSGTTSPKYDKDVLNGKITLTDTQQDLVKYSDTADKCVFILWMSESCNEEDITKCDLSNALTSDSGGQSISGNIDIRLNSGKKKTNSRSTMNIDACTIPRGNAATAIANIEDGTPGDEGSGVYKVKHNAISSNNSATGSEIPSVTDYRYYGASPNNYVLLPDMNTKETIAGCYYDIEEVDVFGKKCLKIYKVDYGNDNYELFDEVLIENVIEAGPGSTNWDSINNKCLYNGEELTSTYEEEITEDICNKFSISGNFYILATELGTGTLKYYTNGLYRIIGSIYEENAGINLVKIIKASPLTDGTTNEFCWDCTSLGNTKFSNAWSRSTLKKLLNNEDWWNRTNGSYHIESGAEISVNFTNYGLTDKVKNMINNSRYYLGGYNSSSVLTIAMYEYERGRITARDAIYGVNSLYWDGNIGLMYLSDYGYAAGNSCATSINLDNYNGDCKSRDWLYNPNSSQWSMIQYTKSSLAGYYVSQSGGVFEKQSNYSLSTSPVFYLSKDVVITGGTGTIDDPYTIGL